MENWMIDSQGSFLPSCQALTISYNIKFGLGVLTLLAAFSTGNQMSRFCPWTGPAWQWRPDLTDHRSRRRGPFAHNNEVAVASTSLGQPEMGSLDCDTRFELRDFFQDFFFCSETLLEINNTMLSIWHSQASQILPPYTDAGLKTYT